MAESSSRTIPLQAHASPADPVPPPHPGGTNIYRTPVIRSDIKFIPPGEHGSYPMIFDPVSESYYKLSEEAVAVMRLMDAEYTLEEFAVRLKTTSVEADKEDLAWIFNFLNMNDLVVPRYGVQDKKLESHRVLMEKSRIQRFASVYLFFRLPPVYPDGFFTFTRPFVNIFFNRFTIFFLALSALFGYVLLVRQWNEAYATLLDSLSWAGLVNYFWALLITKSVHELAHGYTAKSFGARIRSMGISFIVFYPRLFVDLTDTWRLSRAKRTLCDSAGILSELVFGGLAAIVWVYSQPGPLRSTMFYLFAVSTLGTLLVNGNPFIRYDGYYILSDILNIENLMTRSNEYVKAWNRKIFLGLGAVPDSGDCSGALLYLFGTGAFIYRLFLYTSIILIVYFQFTKPVAIIMMIMEVYTMIIIPFEREVKTTFANIRKISVSKTFITCLLIGGAVSLLFIKLPWSYSMPCEIVPESRRLISVTEPGFAKTKLPDEPFKVERGAPLLSLDNVFLEFGMDRMKLSVKSDEAELDLLRSDRETIGDAVVVLERLKTNRISLAELRRRREAMNIYAPVSGVFIPLVKETSPGKYLEKGSVIGEIVSEKLVVYAYARDNEVDKIRPGDTVSLSLRDSLEEYSGRVASINPVAAKFRTSTLILQTGGFVPCYSDSKTGEFTPVNVLYSLTIKMEKNIPALSGRTGIAKVKKSYILSHEIARAMLHVFFREFSF